MELRPSTVPEIEFELQRALGRLRDVDARGELPAELRPLLQLAPPAGASVHVSLRERETGRPLRSGSQAQSWSSRGCGAWIVYELAAGLAAGRPQPRGALEGGANPLRDFVRALDRVEKDPHLRFVSLKWFRDTYLPKRGYDWSEDPDIPRQIVHDAAEKEIILTAKVPNPKTPEFPVTTIRLNREHALVREFLANDGDPAPAAGEDGSESSVDRARRRDHRDDGSREHPVGA